MYDPTAATDVKEADSRWLALDVLSGLGVPSGPAHACTEWAPRALVNLDRELMRLHASKKRS